MKNLFSNNTTRTVICGDSLQLLKNYNNQKCIITSLPDMDEIGIDLPTYQFWMFDACVKLINTLAKDGVIFFYQTNRKYKGRIIDKNAIISLIFYKNGFDKILEKIVLKQEPEIVNRYRPTYTNLFAFSKTLTGGQPTADVIYAGEMIYKNAMGLNAIKVCLDYVKKNVECTTVFDPFCGQGSVLKMANISGYNTVGIDILPEQCKIAESI